VCKLLPNQHNFLIVFFSWFHAAPSFWVPEANEKMVKDISFPGPGFFSRSGIPPFSTVQKEAFPGPPADGSAVHGVDGGYTTPITPTPSFDYNPSLS